MINILQPKSDKEISEIISKLTPVDLLINSCKYGHLTGVKLALDNGADPSIKDNDSFIFASTFGHTEIVELLLKDERVDPSALNNRAIRWASMNGHKEIIELLLKDMRVDPSDMDNYAVQFASLNGHKEIIELLLKDNRVKL